MRMRAEQDSMGSIQVPEAAYYGAQTQRAVQNFPVSGLRFGRRFIRALGLLKKCCAQVNLKRGGLPRRIGLAVVKAAQEVVEGELDNEFVVDIYQTGSGTSTNMNANEVIGNRAIEILGGKKGTKKPVHPNDHVNKGQSSNDVIPTAIHVASLEALVKDLLPALGELKLALSQKAAEFDGVVKIGRTHLQDAVPIRLGQEFSGYAAMMERGIERIKAVFPRLRELALGGTAVGTGLNAEPGFAQAVIQKLSGETGLSFHQADNLFEALASRDACVETSGALKTVAVSLMKISNDIRWLGSGPRCGIGEILLPDLQPGSSIMPGKVNPVAPEMMAMVSAQVIGNDAAITLGGQSGNFELNVMKPMIAYNLLQSIEILSNGARLLSMRCVRGLKANRKRCREAVEKSLAMCTALAPKIGYDKAAEIAKEAYRKDMTVREIVKEKGLLTAKEMERLLDAGRMTEPSRNSKSKEQRAESRRRRGALALALFAFLFASPLMAQQKKQDWETGAVNVSGLTRAKKFYAKRVREKASRQERLDILTRILERYGGRGRAYSLSDMVKEMNRLESTPAAETAEEEQPSALPPTQPTPVSETEVPAEKTGRRALGEARSFRHEGRGEKWMVSLGGSIVFPVSNFSDYSTAFEPSLRALYYFGSGVQFGLGIEGGYQTDTKKTVLGVIEDRLTSLPVFGLLQVNIPIREHKYFVWVEGGAGANALRQSPNGVLATATRFAAAGRLGGTMRMGENGRQSLQVEMGIQYAKAGSATFLRLQPGVRIGFHF